MQETAVPWILKIIPAVAGAILALVLSGDIDKHGRAYISIGVIGKFLSSVIVSLYGGSAFIEHYGLLKMSIMTHGFIMLIFSVFGLLGIGIIYQSIALLKGKPLDEVISEIRSAFVAIWGNSRGTKKKDDQE
ncbi:hypothetical protein [Acinetobacter sp. ANC 4177]|jgi:hypothetical protein|uniref:hypothetical protein n=1 Tax=Acinetobacter sp. ANC 4177 TaxID=2529838 RepID=UPI00103FECA1|nr:hypothetical protein [Acinetobacter sp. ANC 4177]TCB76983.1 hypothetical protein E0H91_01600 [Acinetobacter sp. ANC 4177]